MQGDKHVRQRVADFFGTLWFLIKGAGNDPK